jgi:4'-phosphopantetheinyl transferase
MFSTAELADMIHHVPSMTRTSQNSNAQAIFEAKLRRFYTYFCAKEAYIKLVGEGLLAEWIKECECRNIRVPRPSDNTSWGEKIQSRGMSTERILQQEENDELHIWLHGKVIKNVRIEMQAFEQDFVITTMMRPSSLLGSDVEFPPWEMLDVERDVLHAANDY